MRQRACWQWWARRVCQPHERILRSVGCTPDSCTAQTALPWDASSLSSKGACLQILVAMLLSLRLDAFRSGTASVPYSKDGLTRCVAGRSAAACSGAHIDMPRQAGAAEAVVADAQAQECLLVEEACASRAQAGLIG